MTWKINEMRRNENYKKGKKTETNKTMSKCEHMTV